MTAFQHPNQNRNTDEFHSPWTESYQSNPHHQTGDYDLARDPRTDETLRPTWDALNDLYDSNHRD